MTNAPHFKPTPASDIKPGNAMLAPQGDGSFKLYAVTEIEETNRPGRLRIGMVGGFYRYADAAELLPVAVTGKE